MAYGQQSGNKPAYGNKPATVASAPAKSGTTGPKEALFRTGLFKPNKEGVKAIGSVQVKEDVTIPAGSYLNLYENEKMTSEKSPAFNLTVTAGVIKKQ